MNRSIESCVGATDIIAVSASDALVASPVTRRLTHLRRNDLTGDIAVVAVSTDLADPPVKLGYADGTVVAATKTGRLVLFRWPSLQPLSSVEVSDLLPVLRVEAGRVFGATPRRLFWYDTTGTPEALIELLTEAGVVLTTEGGVPLSAE
jgi:hypothetical protein